MRTIVLTLFGMLLTACASTTRPTVSAPAGHESGEEAAVLAAMDRYVHAISENDLQAMAAMQTRDGMTYRARPMQDGSVEIVGRPNSYWVDPARIDEHAVRERYWSPMVMVRGPIAVVWAPYEFWVDGRTSHCGVDVFDFVKLDGEWRLSNSMWTAEPGACEALRPRDGSAIRPTGPAPTRSSAPDDARPATIPPHQQVIGAERAFAISMADRDLDAFAGFVADEAIFFGGTVPLRGKAQVVSGWSGYFEGSVAPFSWEPDQVEVLESGTLALSTGLVRNPQGRVIARFNSIWRLEAPGV